MGRGWINVPVGGGILHARKGVPDRWDVAVERTWPRPGLISRKRLARAIRQDLWRTLRQVRGFAPRIMVRLTETTIEITAGGVVMTGVIPPNLTQRIDALLDNPKKRALWDAYAHGRRGT